MFTMMHLDNLHVNNSFFLATFELGLCLAVSGDIPTAPLVSLVLLKGRCLVRCCAAKEHCAISRKTRRSAAAFSRDTRRDVHILHTYGEMESVLSTGTSSNVLILDAH